MTSSIDTTLAADPTALGRTAPTGSPGLLTSMAVLTMALLFVGLLMLNDLFGSPARSAELRCAGHC